MGDLVSSERDGAALHMHQHFNAAIDRANDIARPASPLTITLGDEFQGIFGSLTMAARTARDIRLDLLEQRIECRFAIGIVRLDTALNTERAWNMMGHGLADTRAKLNQKRSNNLYRFALPDDSVMEALLESVGASLTMIERNWTETQRRYAIASIHGQTAAAIAETNGVSVHNIYKVRSAGNFDLYSQHWTVLELAMNALDAEHGLSEWE
ncbi:SatD family protein [Sphingomonas hankookensis]|uniref:SatD family (SatD) n=1 Tax=Sphingomonas hengshuiensis TaxID=1609977 RepID=A0A2W4ZAC9_9SPHN|nr:MAG: hypothetical protein DI632_05160 [Sphingomonas hengshuiensis]